MYLVLFEIFSISMTLKPGGTSRSRSLKMAPFDRSYTTLYWSIQNLWLWVRHGNYCLLPFLSYLTLNYTVTLKSGLEVTRGNSNWYHSKTWVRFLSCVSILTRDIDIENLSVRPSVCLSARPLRSGTRLKRLNIFSQFFHHMMAQSF